MGASLVTDKIACENLIVGPKILLRSQGSTFSTVLGLVISLKRTTIGSILQGTSTLALCLAASVSVCFSVIPDGCLPIIMPSRSEDSSYGLSL